MPASQRNARALFLRFTLVASSTWSGKKRKAQDVTQLALPPGCPTLCGQAGRDQPGGQPGQPSPRGSSATPVQKTKTCDDVKVGGWHTGAKPHHRRTEGVGAVWQHPALCWKEASADFYQPRTIALSQGLGPLPRAKFTFVSN